MPIKHVLIVDDSKSATLVLGRMLQGISMTYDTASSGEEALDYLSRKRPDAVFMDHMMPGMDGLQTVKHIRDNPLTVSLPIAMYTSKDSSEYTGHVKSLGIVGVLPKPASPMVLNQIVAQLNERFKAIESRGTETTRHSLEPPDIEQQPLSIAAFKKIAQATASSIVATAFETDLQLQLDERLDQLQNQLSTQVIPSIVESLIDARLHKFEDELRQRLRRQSAEMDERQRAGSEITPVLVDELKARLQTTLMAEMHETAQRIAEQTATAVVNQTAAQIYDTRANEMSKRLVQRIIGQLNEIKSNMQQLSAEDLARVEDIAHKTALEAVQEYSSIIAQQSAESRKSQNPQEVRHIAQSAAKALYVPVILALILSTSALGMAAYLFLLPR